MLSGGQIIVADGGVDVGNVLFSRSLFMFLKHLCFRGNGETTV